MIMKWEDLKKGDVLEINQEFVTEFEVLNGRRPRFVQKGTGNYIDIKDNSLMFIVNSIRDKSKGFIVIDTDRTNISVDIENGTLARSSVTSSVFNLVALCED